MTTMEEMLGKTVVNNKGEEIPISSFAGPGTVVGFYFSAHWCPPCRGFTPELVKFYLKMKRKEKKFEIVFISSDRDSASFNEYFETMPWMALDFSRCEVKEHLGKKFGVRGIPYLILLDGASGEVITVDGRNNVVTDTEGSNFPWKK